MWSILRPPQVLVLHMPFRVTGFELALANRHCWCPPETKMREYTCLSRILLRLGMRAFILRDSASSLLCLCLLLALSASSLRFSSWSESDSSCRCSLLRFLGCTVLFGWLPSSSSSSFPELEDEELSSPLRNERFLRVTDRLSSLEEAPEPLQSWSSWSLSSSGELWKSGWDAEEEEEKEPSSLSSRIEAGRPIWRFFDASTLVFRIDANIFRLYKLSMSAAGTRCQWHQTESGQGAKRADPGRRYPHSFVAYSRPRHNMLLCSEQYGVCIGLCLACSPSLHPHALPVWVQSEFITGLQ